MGRGSDSAAASQVLYGKAHYSRSQGSTDLLYDPGSWSVSYQGEVLSLGKRELDLLGLLWRQKGSRVEFDAIGRFLLGTAAWEESPNVREVQDLCAGLRSALREKLGLDLIRPGPEADQWSWALDEVELREGEVNPDRDG